MGAGQIANIPIWDILQVVIDRWPMKKSVHSEPYSVFAALLASARKRTGMRQIELAQKLNKPQSFVSKFECGERRLDVIEFLTIMDALGEDPLAVLAEAAKTIHKNQK
jgi:hypothetical protein